MVTEALISVIIPVYNVQNYIERALISVINQTYKNLEVICVDDGSTDESGLILDEFEKKDSRIKVIHKLNEGVASARNCALKMVTGDYITFLDPDDWIDEEMYESMLVKIIENDADICGCMFSKNWDNKEIIQENEKILSNEIFDKEKMFLYAFKRYAYKGVGAYLWNKIFKSDILANIEFDTKLAVGEDVMFFTMAVLNAQRFVFCDEPFYHYYQRTDSLCHNSDIEKRKGSLITFQRIIDIFEKESFDDEIVNLAKRFYTYHSSLLAERAYMVHDRENMRSMQKNIGKYLDAYIKTSGDHEEWNHKMILMQTDVEKAIAYSRNLKDAERRNAYATALKLPIKNNYILYESFFGRGMVCAPYAMFLSILNMDCFNDYIHVWSISNKDELARLQDEYSNHENVIFVLRSSNEYVEYLATSKYLINNDNFFYFFVKRDEQIYLNTWHGIPMKKLGYDVPDGIIEQHNSFRNFRMTDYLLGWNEHMKIILSDAYSLNTNYSGEIVLSGCPRNDITLSADKEKVISKLRSFGVQTDTNKKIVLYAPTFRGTNLQNASSNVEEVLILLDKLKEADKNDEYIFLFKPHHLVYQAILDTKIEDARIIPAFMDANEIMSLTDILISDYSSIYLDFLVTDRPIVFYVPDEEDYKEYRGLYYDTSKLPGKVCKTIDDVKDFFNNISVNSEYMSVYEEYKKWACKLDDGHVCDSLWERLLNHHKTEVVKKQSGMNEVLILCGSLYEKEVFAKLLANIEKHRDDCVITVLFDQPKTEQLKGQIIDEIKGVRALSRVTAIPMTYEEEKALEAFESGQKTIDDGIKEILAREKKRCLYDMIFDEVIDISESALMKGMFAKEDLDTDGISHSIII